jgi:hypothetical protein
MLGPQFKKAGMASGRASLMKAWGRYKGLSHFFAAAIHRPSDFKEMMVLLNLGVGKQDIARSEDDVLPLTAKNIRSMMGDVPKFVAGYKQIGSEILPRFFATAERFRGLGEKHFAPGQRVRKKPLLDKNIMWRIPRGFKIPHIQIAFKRLNKLERAAISSVVKSKR